VASVVVEGFAKGVLMFRNALLICSVALSVSFERSYGQTNIEQRLGRLEARVDSLVSALKNHSQNPVNGERLSDNSNLLYGIISIKGTVLDKGYFVINHNNEWKIPYWVAYYLSKTNLQGSAARTDDFRPDPELPAGSRAELEDYRNSGYDRGHNAPAGDFTRSREAMSTTFLLSNMCPQTPRLNRGIWDNLEEQVRTAVSEKGEGWIITGNVFMTPDSHFTRPTEYIGLDSVAVPTHCFKAILLLDENHYYSMYAFLLPNLRDNIPGSTADYLIKVDRLEQITGYDFFPILADSIENKLESTIPNSWPR
jgi:endonuclease G